MTPPKQDINGRNGSAIRSIGVAVSPDRPAKQDDWLPYHFALADLPRSKRWANSLAFKFERKNAMRNPAVDTPAMYVSGADCVQAGATESDMRALHKLTVDEIAALRLEAATIRKASQIHIDDAARRLANGREITVAAPEPCSLTALLDEPDTDAQYRIEDAWAVGGRVLLAAQYKAGKSTLVGNTTKSLVDGVPFLGRFGVTPVDHVALIDTELDRRTLRRELHRHGIRNTGAVTVVSLRGAVSTFDIIDPQTRSEWARRMAGANVVILDCLRPVLDALGLSEDKDAGKLLVAFDALLAEIGASEGLVVTHMGHQNGPASERARGDSRLLDWPDALWKIVRSGDETDDDGNRHRYFSAMGRDDVSVPEGLLTFDAASRHLSLGEGGRKAAASSAAIPQLLEMVAAAPGELSKNKAEKQLIEEHGLAQKDARDTVNRAIRNGLLTVTKGPRGAQLLSPGGVDPFTLPLVESTDSEGK